MNVQKIDAAYEIEIDSGDDEPALSARYTEVYNGRDERVPQFYPLYQNGEELPQATRWFGPDLIDEYKNEETRSSTADASNRPQSTSNFNSTHYHETHSAFAEPSAIDRFGFLTLPRGGGVNHTGDGRSVNSDADEEKYAKTIPIETFRRRETKWLEMLNNWQHYMQNDFELIRKRCRKGIPGSLRGRAWTYLCGAHQFIKENDGRSEIFEMADQQPDDTRWCDDIDKDLNRQFPEHELFARDGPFGLLGQSELRRVLKAYALTHPAEGYCQAQAPVAATLLMHMPRANAFHCLTQICRYYVPGYYSPGLKAVQLDGRILNALLKERLPLTYQLFKKHSVEPVLYMVEWFMCMYCRTLPWNIVLRIWDVFLCEGVKVLFKVAIVLLRATLGTRAQTRRCDDMYAVVHALKNIDVSGTLEQRFMIAVERVDISEKKMQQLHYKQMKKQQKEDAALK